MTVGYESERNVIYENHPDYVHEDENGELILDIDQMPNRKLGNLQNAVENAIEANNE